MSIKSGGEEKKTGLQIREIDLIVKVSGVPFLSETRVNKVQKYYKEG